MKKLLILAVVLGVVLAGTQVGARGEAPFNLDALKAQFTKVENTISRLASRVAILENQPAVQEAVHVPQKRLWLVDNNDQKLGILLDSETDGLGQNHRIFLPRPGAIVDLIEYVTDTPSYPGMNTVQILSADYNAEHTIYFSDSECTYSPMVMYPVSQFSLVHPGINGDANRYFMSPAGNTTAYSPDSMLTSDGCEEVFLSGMTGRNLTEVELPFADPIAWPLKVVFN